MRAFYGGQKRLFSAKLNCLIDRQNDRLTGMRLHLIALKRAALRITLDKKLARFAANAFIIKLLNPTEAHFISAHKTKNVRGERVVRVIALRLFARVDALKVKCAQFGSGLLVQASHDPDELFVRFLCFY